MIMRRAPMTCPDCGAAMNRHAEKLVEHPEAAAETPQRLMAFGGPILEAHACPDCGTSATRPVTGTGLES